MREKVPKTDEGKLARVNLRALTLPSPASGRGESGFPFFRLREKVPEADEGTLVKVNRRALTLPSPASGGKQRSLLPLAGEGAEGG